MVSNAYVPKAKATFGSVFDNETAGRKGGVAIVGWLDKHRGADWRKKEGVIIELRCIITASFDIGRSTGYHSGRSAVGRRGGRNPPNSAWAASRRGWLADRRSAPARP